MAPLVRQVMKQTRARIFRGDTREPRARSSACQRRQTPKRPQPLPLQRRRRNETLGRARRHRRQPHQPRPGLGQAAHSLVTAGRQSARHNASQPLNFRCSIPPDDLRRDLLSPPHQPPYQNTPILRRKVAKLAGLLDFLAGRRRLCAFREREELDELRSRPAETALDRADLDLANRRRLLVRQTVRADEDQHFALL